MSIGGHEGDPIHDALERRERRPLADYRRLAGLCLLYTSDAADERSSVDLGGRRIIKKKKSHGNTREVHST